MKNKLLNFSFIRFLIVGVINTIVGMSIMFGAYNLLGLDYWVSSALNYVLTSILSFFLNKYFTFRDHSHDLKQVLRFAANIAVCYLLAYGIARPAVAYALQGSSQTLTENIAMLVGMCLFVFLNYFGQRFFAFRKKRQPEKNTEKDN